MKIRPRYSNPKFRFVPHKNLRHRLATDRTEYHLTANDRRGTVDEVHADTMLQRSPYPPGDFQRGVHTTLLGEFRDFQFQQSTNGNETAELVPLRIPNETRTVIPIEKSGLTLRTSNGRVYQPGVYFIEDMAQCEIPLMHQFPGDTFPFFLEWRDVKQHRPIYQGDFLAVFGETLPTNMKLQRNPGKGDKWELDLGLRAYRIDPGLGDICVQATEDNLVLSLIIRPSIQERTEAKRAINDPREVNDRLSEDWIKTMQERRTFDDYMREYHMESRFPFQDLVRLQLLRYGNEQSVYFGIDALIERENQILSLRRFGDECRHFDYHFGSRREALFGSIRRLVPGVVITDMVLQRMALEPILHKILPLESFTNYHLVSLDHVQFMMPMNPNGIGAVKLTNPKILPSLTREGYYQVKADQALVINMRNTRKLDTLDGSLGNIRPQSTSAIITNPVLEIGPPV